MTEPSPRQLLYALVAGGFLVVVAVLVLIACLRWSWVNGLHPRMASEQHGPTVMRQLEPPGFLLLNYGRQTPLATIIAHIAYGAIVGGFVSLAS